MVDKVNIYKIIGENIRKYRINLSLSQEELANKIELTRSSIVQIESGKQALTIHSLYKIAEALKLSIYKILPDFDKISEFDSYSIARVMQKDTVLDLLNEKQKGVMENG
jgi:transcriptional regulator with XRE-family HTH domain